jgi:UDP-2,3-diacylglucosamine pyrophosphatase LpxH
MVVIAVSDVHLGCLESNFSLFKSFLNYIESMENLEHFVIIGDFVDMWRRDVSGLFLENYEVVQSLIKMKNKNVGVHYIAGNHDFHLLKLVGHNYPFIFEESVTLKISDVNYVFRHGHEFDCKQRRGMCELLCYNLSDKAGRLRSDFWKLVIGKPDFLKELEGKPLMAEAQTGRATFDLESWKIEDLENLMKPPNEREGCKEIELPSKMEMVNPFISVEDNAAATVKEKEVLIFGHTHRPFANDGGRLFNTGSWMSNEETPNTYIVINGKNVSLMQYDGSKGNDITESKKKYYKIAHS